MKWQPSQLYKIRQVITITVIWILAGVLVELNNAINYNPVSGEYVIYFVFGNSLLEHLLITAIGPFLGGIIAGSFIVFYQREKLKGKTYLLKILSHSLIYILFLSLFILVVGIIGALNNPSESSFKEKLFEDIFSLRILRLMVTWYFIVTLTIFFLDVSERYGLDIFRKQLMGKYHLPGQEDRVFMFLDLNSSTTIAEKIGDEKYFQMLRYFYEIANEAIMNTYGDIYQYIGDEIVISWEKEEGMKNANCLNCFKAIRDVVEQNREIFTERFGVVPEFKAAIHMGTVSTGEIGLAKKDIVYSGDVLNTTSRMVALCKKYQVDLIVSEVLYEEIKNTPDYKFIYIDNPVLRGKVARLGLYSVELC